ncbi:MAG: hypothetical protein AAB456_04215, partial [Patescibacteria group bacterium]
MSVKTKTITGVVLISSISLLFFTVWPKPAKTLGAINPNAFFNNSGVQVYETCDLTKPKIISLENDLPNLRAKNPDNSLRSLNVSERNKLIGCEYAKIGLYPKERRISNYFDGYIQITKINYWEFGVEYYAKAWDKNNQPLGFGKDGTVEIERFHVANLGHIISDPLGGITRQELNGVTNQFETHKFREDLKEILLKDLEHTLKTKTLNNHIHSGENIVIGKIGNTTTTCRPAAGGSSPVDSASQRNVTNEAWGTIRDGAGTGVSSNAAATLGHPSPETGTSAWNILSRAHIYVDCSAIPDTDTKDSATFSWQGDSNGNIADNDFSLSLKIYLASSSVAAQADIISSDYDIGSWNLTTLSGSTTRFQDYDVAAFNDYAFNANGISLLSVTGLTKIGLMTLQDASNTAPTFVGSQFDNVVWRTGDQADV